MDGCKDGWINVRMDITMVGYKDDRWMDEWVDGWM